MVWHEAYEDQIIERLNLPLIPAKSIGNQNSLTFPVYPVTIGVMSLEGLREVGIWRRLLNCLDLPKLVLGIGMEPEMLKSATPRSEWDLTYSTLDTAWSSSFRVDRLRSSIAIFGNSVGQNLTFLGLPTEQGYERIEQFLNS